MAIPGDVFRAIQNALLSAYPTRASLREMVRIGISELLDAIADGKNQTELVFDLVSWAEARGRLKELIDAAVRDNPKNPELVALVADAQVIAILNGLAESQEAANQRWAQYEQLWASVQDRYFDWIVETYGSIRIFGQTTPKPLHDIFTDTYVLDTPTAHRRFKHEELSEHLWNEDRGISFRYDERKAAEDLFHQGDKFLVLGKPGAGKTTLLKWLAVRETGRGRWADGIGKVPIYVSLKQYADNNISLLDYVTEQFAICKFASGVPVVKELLESGRALVLFDGLDEVTNADGLTANTRGHVALELDRFALLYSNCHIVISCRIAALDFTFADAFTYLEMADFSPEQVEHFIRQWFSDDVVTNGTTRLAEQMLSEWAKPEHRDIRDLARSPLLLTLLCLNYAETQSFPIRRVEIYEEALDALLKKWDSTRQVLRGTLYKALSLGRKRQMFARIAYDAFVQNKILFEQSELEASLVAYLAHVPELPTPIDIDGEDILEEIIANHGIFAQQAYGLYSFSHLTLQEYFAAKHIVENYSTAALDTMFEHITDDKWREVILMTTSLLADATDFLTKFATTLQALVVANSDLAAVMTSVHEYVANSKADYRAPYARLLSLALWLNLARTTNLGHIVDLSAAVTLDLAYALARPSDIDLAIVRTKDIDRAFESIIDETNDQDSDYVFDVYRARTLARALAFELNLTPEVSHTIALTRTHIGDIMEYIFASRLYYDCIQLAYTPNRCAYEDRILEPPP